MRITLSAFAPVRRRVVKNVSRQQALRFLSSPSRMPNAGQNDTNNNIEHAEEPKQVYILGVGNIGTFVAHALGSIPQPPKVTLMLHTTEHYNTWHRFGRRLVVQRNGLSEHKTGYDVTWLEDGVWYRPFLSPGSDSQRHDGRNDSVEVDSSPIDHLILTVKTIRVITALNSISHRLTPHSTITFIHNGMGVIEEVNKKVFPDPETRPSYILGVISHGLTQFRSYNVMHKGVGITSFGVLYSNPEAALLGDDNGVNAIQQEDNRNNNKAVSEANRMKKEEPLAPTTSYLLRTFARTPIITPLLTSKTDIILFQLEKLAINALINPITVLSDCVNGDLLNNEYIERVQRLLLLEISTVIGALPELQGVPGIKTRFSPQRLLSLAQKATEKTAANANSMLHDATAGRPTEIAAINGYIVKRGEDLGIHCALNFMLINLVEGKAKIMAKNAAGEDPLGASVSTSPEA